MSDPNVEQNETEDLDDDVDDTTETEKSNPRLEKMVNILLKTTGIKKEKLKDKTLEEQFDFLNFFAENMPKRRKRTNKPVVPIPSETDKKPKYPDGVSESKDSKLGTISLIINSKKLFNKKKRK